MKHITKNIDRLYNIRRKLFVSQEFLEYKDALEYLNVPETNNFSNIPRAYQDPNYLFISNYMINPYKDLYRKVRAYANAFEERINGCLEYHIIVHPFYPLFRHCNLILANSMNCDYLHIYEEYEAKIFTLLHSSTSNIILFDTPDSFAMYTHKFFKIGHIKKVVFTSHSKGAPLKGENLTIDSKSCKMSICGCYKNDCINDVIMYLNSLKQDYNCCILDDITLSRPY